MMYRKYILDISQARDFMPVKEVCEHGGATVIIQAGLHHFHFLSLNGKGS